MRGLGGLLVVVVSGACVSEVEPGRLAGVEVGGCAEMFDAPGESSCELVVGGSRQISVWVPGAAPTVRIDDTRQEVASPTEIDGGYRIELEIPDGARVLTLSREEPTEQRWRLPFVWADPHTTNALTRAIMEMQTAYRESELPGCQRAARVVYMLARQQRRNIGAMLAARSGTSCTDAGSLREWALDAAQIPVGMDEREVDRADIEVQFFVRQGALSQALVAADRGRRLALHLGMANTYVELALTSANLLLEIGDLDGALATMNEVLGRDSDPCTRASIHLNLAWAHLQRAERAAAKDVDEVHHQLRRGLALGTEHACRREDMISFGLNAVRALQYEREWERSDAELEALVQPLATLDAPPIHAEFRLLKARAALALGQPLAARVSLGSADLPEGLPLDLELDLMVARGEVEAALGMNDRSLAAYLDAHRRTLGRLRGVPWDRGRQRFVFDRLRGAQRLVEVYRGPFADDAAAFRVAREAAGAEARWLARRDTSTRIRRDYLTWRAEREGELVAAWDLPPEDRRRDLASARRETDLREAALFAPADSFDPSGAALRPPRPDELVLLYFPTGAHQFLIFGATTAGTKAASIELTSSELLLQGDGLTAGALQRWSERLLEPMAAEVDRARRIRILPSFGVQALPFHALPWRGRPLLAHADVVYSLDLPVRAASNAVGGALIVGDPLGDLEGAREEVDAVRAAHVASGVEVVSLVGQQATGPNVRRLLPQVRHLHYAGHSTTAGAFGWDSTLRLAHDTSLTVADIVAFERVPQTVVLLSCHGGHVSRDPRSQGVSLAAAFLFAGSEAVIAMATPVAEAEALLLASSFHVPPTDASALSVTYRTATLHLLETTASGAAWQGLRLWVP